MTSILISSDVLEMGEAVAREVTEALGATFVGREILPDIAKQHGVSKADLLTLLGFSGKFGLYQKRLLMCLESAVAARIREDNVVCTGLGAHLYVRNISHILNIRVLSDLESVIQRRAAQNNVSPAKVRKNLEKQMRRRREWTVNAFGVDEVLPSNYDMLFTLGNFDVDRVVKTVVETSADRKFTAMTYSRKCLDDQVLAAKVRLALVNKYSDVRVRTKDGTAFLTVGKGWGWRKKVEAVKRIASEVEGVGYVRVDLVGSSGNGSGGGGVDAA